MTTAYELLGIGPNATRAELDAAYRAKRAAYDPTRVAALGEEFVQIAGRRRAELVAAYASLRPALTAPPRLEGAAERRRDRETIAVLLIFLLVVLAVLLLRNVAVPQRTTAVTGADAAKLTAQTAPDFTLESLDGRRVSLSDYQGQVVLVNFWATWCPPCVRETPRLVRVYERYRDQGLVVLGINTTYQDDRAKVESFVRDQGIAYPVLLEMEPEVGRSYATALMPSSYLIDQEGKIAFVRVGEVDEAQLDEQVAALLQSKSAAP
jgi:cytochrome c biogenesis protein CcmG/thiol:disulfide interchange protein DsbE